MIRRFHNCSKPLVLLLFCLSLLAACERRQEAPIKVNLAPVEQEHAKLPGQSPPELRIAVSAVISPKETFVLYKDLLNHISEKLGMRVQLVQRETYAEVNNLVRDNQLELAFVCSGAYIDGHDQFGMQLLVAPVAYGEPLYHSYIIVPATSPIADVKQLRGKHFAFTDPMSNSGKLAPTYMLAQLHETPESFFSSVIFTNSHDRSIEMVASNLVDGASVDSLIWEYLDSKNPALTSRTRIIWKSEPYGIPPVVVPKGLDPELKEKLRQVFLNLDQDESGRQILARLKIDRFVVLEDSRYDSIRKMQRLVSGK
jgi:phosphonate transport system substrate-binding protein